MDIIKNIFLQRKLIINLAKNDFKTRYAGSIFGIFWAFVQPVVTIVVYWLVFAVGFKSGQNMDVPFVLYLISGIIPWFLLSDSISGGSSSLVSYSFLVKKVVFPVEVIPTVKLVAALIVHIFFVVFTMILCVCYGYWPSLYWIQILYYSFCTFTLALGISYFFGAITCFFRDMSQIVSIILQVGVWTAPIMWDVNLIGVEHQWILKLNPIYYIVFGYRDAFYDENWFFEKPLLTLYYWAVTIVLFIVGSVVFKKLRPHFADVL